MKRSRSGLSFLSERGFGFFARAAVIYALMAILFLLNLTALPLPYAGLVKPHLVLITIYYWSIYRPTFVPSWLCFVAGLMLDILSGTPAGLQALTLVIVQWVVRDQRRFLMAQPYVTIWALFALVLLVSSFGQWLIFGVINAMQWPAILPAVAGVLMTFFLFPFITLALIGTHRILPVASRAYP